VDGTELLIVEDDERVASALHRALVAQGFSVDCAHTGTEALTRVRDDTAIVILDLGLPDIDGIEVCQALRGRVPNLQILILSARREEVEIVVGLDAGADDYLVKPFALGELLARLRVCERRRGAQREQLTVDELTIDVDARHAALAGEELTLSNKEFDLLVELVRGAGTVVRRKDLLTRIWDEHWYGSTKTIDTHVWSLRRKLDSPDQPSRITTVRGIGYRLERHS